MKVMFILINYCHITRVVNLNCAHSIANLKNTHSLYMSNIGVLVLHQYICGLINKIHLQRFDIFTSWSKYFDTKTLLTVFVDQ